MQVTFAVPTDTQCSGAAVGGHPHLWRDHTLKMTRCASFQDAQHLREEWDALVEQVNGDLFSSFDWCAIWWKHFGRGRRLELYVARAGQELVAVLPLFTETIRWGPLFLRVVRIVGCDHCVTTCNVTIRPDWFHPVISALMSALDGRVKWDLIHFGELPGYSENGQALADALRRCEYSGRVIFRDNDYPHAVFDVPSTFERYLASLASKERRNVRRDERKLESEGGERSFGPGDKCELEQTFSRLIEMHQVHWNQRGRLGHFCEWPNIEPFYAEIAEALLERGRLVLVAVSSNGLLQAAEFGGQFGRRAHWITSSRREGVTSRIGFCTLVRWALWRGVRQIDSLPGYYDYKRRLGAQFLGIKNITVLSPRLMFRVRCRLFRAVTWLVVLVYFRVWHYHVAPWLRLRLPNLQVWPLRACQWQRLIRSRFLVVPKGGRSRESCC